MSRPSKLDDLTAKRIIDAVGRGLPRDTSAKLARISPSTLYDWLARGRNGEEPYAEFLERVKAAEAKGEDELVAIVRAAAKDTDERRGQWQAAAWLLERRRPEAYALKREPTKDEPAGGVQNGTDLDVARSVVAALESRKTG